jgi:hypothetical protein
MWRIREFSGAVAPEARESGFPCLRLPNIKEYFVHSEHEVFIQGIEQERKLEVKFFCRKRQREVVSLCAPLHYCGGPVTSPTDVESELVCYYLWDFGVKKGSNFLALKPSEIFSMKLTKEVFHVQDFYENIKGQQKP